MIRSILKILWKERKKFIGIIIEQAFIFILLFISLAGICKTISKYKEPGLFNTNNIILFGYITNNSNYENNEYKKISTNLDALIQSMNNKPYITGISESIDFIPYLREENSYTKDSVQIDNKIFQVFFKGTDIYAPKVFDIELEKGKWLPNEVRLENGNIPIVITRKFAEEINWDNPIGKTIKYKTETLQITGVLSGFRHDILTPPVSAIILNYQLMQNPMFREVCAKIKNGYENEFNKDFQREFKRLVEDNNITTQVTNLDNIKSASKIGMMSQIGIKLIPTLFLFTFAFIGNLGITLQNTKKRIREFGLRIAIGATRKKIFYLIIIENILITLISSLPGLLLAFLIYPINGILITTILIAMSMMLIFSVLSTWYPICHLLYLNPAEALHNE